MFPVSPPRLQGVVPAVRVAGRPSASAVMPVQGYCVPPAPVPLASEVAILGTKDGGANALVLEGRLICRPVPIPREQ